MQRNMFNDSVSRRFLPSSVGAWLTYTTSRGNRSPRARALGLTSGVEAPVLELVGGPIISL
jgi:hypothetical protein